MPKTGNIYKHCRPGIPDPYLIPRIQQIEKGLEAFQDPAWQMLLISANKRAATTTSADSYAVLSELMAKRFEERANVKSNAVIEKAIEVMGLISDDAFLALSLLRFLNLSPTTGNIHDGLRLMNDTLSSILNNMQLPRTKDWIENLEVLNIIKQQNGLIIGTTDLICQYYEMLNGYTVVGIEKDSAAYNEALKSLISVNLPVDLLVSHQLNPGFVRLNFRSKSAIDKLSISAQQRAILIEIFNISQKIPSGFDMRINLANYIAANFPALNAFKEWYKTLKAPLLLTPIGNLLADMNTRRIIPNLPPIT